MTNDDTVARQVALWDSFSQMYLREMDHRFAEVVDGVLSRADLAPNESVLDIGTGTGSIAIAAGRVVGEGGDVTGIDISEEMLRLADNRLMDEVNIMFRQGSATEIPAVDNAFDVVLSSLTMMFVPDRATAAKEIARVLKPAGRFVASVWAGPEECDLVKLQGIAASYAPEVLPEGVGPGALADPLSFQAQLLDAGIDTDVEIEETGFEFDDFDSAWETVVAFALRHAEPARIEAAKRAVQDAMWPGGEGSRYFRNTAHFIVGRKRE